MYWLNYEKFDSHVCPNKFSFLKEQWSVGADPGFGVRGAKFGEGSWDRLGPPVRSRAEPWWGNRGWSPPEARAIKLF